MSKFEKVKIFLMGVIVALLLVFVVDDSSVKTGQGRYQISVANERYAWVIDTETGLTKHIGASSPGKLKVNFGGNPFP